MRSHVQTVYLGGDPRKPQERRGAVRGRVWSKDLGLNSLEQLKNKCKTHTSDWSWLRARNLGCSRDNSLREGCSWVWQGVNSLTLGACYEGSRVGSHSKREPSGKAMQLWQ